LTDPAKSRWPRALGLDEGLEPVKVALGLLLDDVEPGADLLHDSHGLVL